MTSALPEPTACTITSTTHGSTDPPPRCLDPLPVQDIDASLATLVIYAYRAGDGIGQHPNANRGAAAVNFATGTVETVCSDNEFITLHGALMLIAWMILAPFGIYYARSGGGGCLCRARARHLRGFGRFGRFGRRIRVVKDNDRGTVVEIL